MKRTKFILLALVAAMVLMGAAYAAWTQAFTIQSTVSTGELFVKIAQGNINKVEVQKGTTYEDVTSSLNTNYLTYSATETAGDPQKGDSQSATLSKISYNLSKMYPGTRLTNTLTFQNLGTMKTKTVILNTSNISDTDSALWNALVIKVNNGNAIAGTGATKLTNLENAILAAIGEELEPDATATTITIVQELPYTSTDATENIIDFSWTIDLQFEQFSQPIASPQP